MNPSRNQWCLQRCQRQNSLDQQVHDGHDERLEHDRRHAVSALAVEFRGAPESHTGCSSGATLSSPWRTCCPTSSPFQHNCHDTVLNGHALALGASSGPCRPQCLASGACQRWMGTQRKEHRRQENPAFHIATAVVNDERGQLLFGQLLKV